MRNSIIALVVISMFNGCASSKQKLVTRIRDIPNRAFWNIYIKGDTVIYESKHKYDFEYGLNPLRMDNKVETINFQYFFIIKDPKLKEDVKKVFKRLSKRGVEVKIDDNHVLNIYDSYDFRVSGCPTDSMLNVEIELINQRLMRDKILKKSEEFKIWCSMRRCTK